MFRKMFKTGRRISTLWPHSATAPKHRRGAEVRIGFERLEDRHMLSAATLINEIKINPPGKSDNRYMYVELEGTPGASLNNVWFVAFDSGGLPEMVEQSFRLCDRCGWIGGH